MTAWLRKIVVPKFEDPELNRRALNLNVILLSTFCVMALGIVAMLLQLGKRPLSYVLPNTLFIGLAALIVTLCYSLSRAGRVQAGSLIFVTMMTVASVGAVVVGGTQGALGVILIIPVAAAGITLGSNVGLGMAIFSVFTLLVVGFLERSGQIDVQYPDPETMILLNMFDVGFALFFVMLSIWLTRYSLRQSLHKTQEAAIETERYRQQLENSLTAEKNIRDRLQRAIGEYAAFLGQIGRGNYQARLSLAQEDESLAMLERQINSTVDTLVAAIEQSQRALQEAKSAQRRYSVQAWRKYVRSTKETTYEATQPGDITQGDKLTPTLRKALTRKRIVTSPQQEGQKIGETDLSSELALPIQVGGQVIGLLGLSRDEGPWTENDQALIETVMDRLALTLDGMRLLDETQRRAAREQLISEITSRVRETLDLETVLKTAAQETRQALELPEVTIRLESSSIASGASGAAGINGHGHDLDEEVSV